MARAEIVQESAQEPVGLRQAVEDRQAAAEAATQADAAQGAAAAMPAPESPAQPSDWESAARLALELVDQVVGRWCPGWEPSGASLETGARSWGAWLATVASAPTPLQQALAWSAMRYGPPLWIGFQARRKGIRPDAQAEGGAAPAGPGNL